MNKRLHVGNLSVDTTAATITEVFQRDGRKVSKVSLVMSRDPGRSRGFAFVDMESDDDALEAVKALHGSQVDGREVRITEAHGPKSRFGGTALSRPVVARTAATEPPVPVQGNP